MHKLIGRWYFSLLVVVLCHGQLLVFGQGEWNNWYFGNKAGITFNSGTPVTLLDGQMAVTRSSVSVSDSLGNLLFYSDGQRVWNKNHQVMPNGTGLQGGFLEDQSVCAVQNPKDDSTWYLFILHTISITPVPVSNGGLHYSVINLRLNGGLGDIEAGQKEIPLQTTNDFPMLMTTTRHHNNRDAWVVIRNMYNANNYAAYLIDTSGVSTNPVISQSSMPTPPMPYANPGTMRISPDGSRLVYPVHDTVEVCHFNSYTGEVTPQFFLEVGAFPNIYVWHYMEFSQNSKYLYISTADWSWTSNKIFQYDASLTDKDLFKQSETLIGSLSRGSQLQLAPDGKIYGTQNGIDSMCVINNPNMAGTACDFQPNALFLQGRICYQGLPQFLQKYKADISYATLRCQHVAAFFFCDVWPPADSVRWNFGDPASGSANISTLNEPTHIYHTPGTYMVELYVRHNDNRTDTTLKSIEIYPSSDPQLGPDRTICTGDSVVLDAGVWPGFDYLWSNLTTGQLFISFEQTYTVKTTGLYTVYVVSENGCHGDDTISVTVVNQPQVLNTSFSKSICSGESTDWLLVSDQPSTVFHWTPTLISGNITGFTADSGLIINDTLINNGLTSGMVVYHVTPKIGSCAGETVDFTVTVTPGTPVAVSIAASGQSVCAGTTVQFTANPVNPGTNPVYQWKVNGINAGNAGNAGNAVFSYVPVNGDQVSCILTSSNTVCVSNNPAFSDTLTMTVYQPSMVSVSIATPSNAVCLGETAAFTAIPVNAGNSPFFEWQVNGNNLGPNAPIFSYLPTNGDVVSCRVSSSATCVAGSPAVSNSIAMTVCVGLSASVSISCSPAIFCEGNAVAFQAVPVNGGANPSYQWKVNGQNQSGNSSTFSYTPQPGDSVRCVLISNLACVTGSPASSASIILNPAPKPNVSYTACFDTITTLNAQPFLLKGGLPPGGTFTGPGVNSATGIFNPAAAGAGMKTISYAYQNTYTCQDIKTKTIKVLVAPSFVCGQNFTDPRDNKVYPTVHIGNQCWMQTNLEYGTAIQTTTPQMDNCIAEYYSLAVASMLRPDSTSLISNLKSDSSNLKSQISNLKFEMREGTFYQWDELMGYNPTPGAQGLCPPGWHVPAAAEWDELLTFFNGAGQAGDPMKDTMLPNGFQSFQRGFLYQNNTWAFTNGLKAGSLYWSSTASGNDRAVARGLNEYNPSVSWYSSLRSNGFGVRCCKDNQ